MSTSHNEKLRRISEESQSTADYITCSTSKRSVESFRESSQEHNAWTQTIQPISRSIQDSYPNVFSTLPAKSPQIVWQGQTSPEHEGQDIIEVPDLPPADGGRRAWLFMVGASLVEGMMWGFPLTFGVFQNYYDTNPPFENNKYIPLVGTLCTGISYMAPLVAPLTIKYPAYQRYMIWGGFTLCISALIGGSFATKIWHLIVTQGLLYGVGFLLVYYPVLCMLNEWFVKRRGMAYGLMFGAAGAFGLGLPFLLQLGLNNYGHAVTLRAFAIAIFCFVGPTLPLLRGRIPPRKEVKKFQIDTRVFSNPTFIFISLSNLFQGLVFFLPSIFITTYARDLSISKHHATLILSLLNVTQILGEIIIGHLSDIFSPSLPMLASTFLTTLTVLLIWGFAKTFALLVVFGLFYGLFAGGYSVLYCRFVTMLTDDHATGLWLYSIFEFQRGVGNIVGGIVSGHLLLGEGMLVEGEYALGRWMGLVLFVGCGFLLSSLLGAPGLLLVKKRDRKCKIERRGPD